MFWQLVLTVIPFPIFLSIAMAISLQSEFSKLFCCCTFWFILTICSFGWTLLFFICTTAWTVLLFLNLGSVQRLSECVDISNRRFWERQYEWILHGACNVIDVEDREILIPKHRDRKLRVCVLNKALLEHQMTRLHCQHRRFHDFLVDESTSNYANVCWSVLRRQHAHESDGSMTWRNAQFLRAMFFDFFGYFFFNKRSVDDWEDMIEYATFTVWTFICGPLYCLSRCFSVSLPFLFPLYLVINEGIEVFWSMDSFQLIIWSGYVSALLVWICGMGFVCRDEFYLWHILPNQQKLRSIEKEPEKLQSSIYAAYHHVAMLPVVRKILMVRFGVDVSNIILDYLY